MKILLDTHIFLWSISEPEKIPSAFLQELESLANTCFVSSVSIAEIMFKSSIGKLDVQFDPLLEAEEAGLELLEYQTKDAIPLKDLPFHHRDPFDRMLIAQSMEQKLKIMTCDHKFAEYECDMLKLT